MPDVRPDNDDFDDDYDDYIRSLNVPAQNDRLLAVIPNGSPTSPILKEEKQKQPDKQLDLVLVEKFWNQRKKEFIDRIFPQFFAQTLFDRDLFAEKDFQEYQQWSTDCGDIDDHCERRRIYKDLNERIWEKLLLKIQKDPNRLMEIVDALRVNDWYNKLADDWQLHLDDEWKKQQQQHFKFDENCHHHHHAAMANGHRWWLDKSKLKMINFPEPIAKHIDRRQKRKEIISYLETFAKNGKGWLILYGTHGSGKTVLAESSVRKLKSELFADGIFWIQIGDLPSTEEMFDQTLYLKMEILYDSIKFLHENSESKSDKLEKIKTDLKRHFLLKPKSLIILDDVRSEHTLKHFNFGVPVLVTTVDKSVASNTDNIEYHFVSITNDGTDTILKTEESIDLLRKYLPKELHQDYLRQSRYLPNILETVNGVPYYIPLIANYMMPLVDNLNNLRVFNPKLCDQLDSTIWKELSEMLHDNLCDELLKKTIDDIQNRKPELVEYLYDFSIFVDAIPQSVLNVLWARKFHKQPKINMGQILQQLINKSLLKVHNGVRKSKTFMENNKLYSIHDLTARFLGKQLGPEKQKERHSILIDSFESYLKNDANALDQNDDEEREQIKNYIHHCLSLHIYSSGRYDLFPKYFLDLNFLKEKIRYVGQSHILVEFENFRSCFNGSESRMEDMQRFIASSADISEPSEIDLFQLALGQPNDSFVYREAINKLNNNQGFYFEWCNKDNYALENQLVKLRFKCKDNTKYASLSPNSKYIATINDCELNLYDGKTGNRVDCQKRHNGTINHCTFSLNGQYLLTTSDDGKAIVWHSPLTRTDDHQSVEPFDGRKRTNSYSSALYVFKELMQPTNKLKADSLNIDMFHHKYRCGDICPKNTYALLGTTKGYLHLFSVEKSHFITGLANPDNLEYEVETCCFSPNDPCFMFNMSNFVYVYKLVADENNNDSVKITLLYKLIHEDKVYNAVFNPERRSKSCPINIFSSSGKYICEWNLKHHSFASIRRKLWNSKAQQKEHPNTKYVLPNDVQGLISFCAVSPKGDSVAGFECNRFEIYIWHVRRKSREDPVSHCIPLHTLSNISTMSFSADGTRLLSLNSKNEITFWDIKEFASVSSVVDLKDDFAAAINQHDSKLNVLTIDNKGFLRLFKDKTGIEDQQFKSNLKQKLKQHLDEPSHHRHQPKFSIICCDISPNGYSIFCTNFGDVFFYKHDDYQLIHHQQPDSEKISKCKFIPNQNNGDDNSDYDDDDTTIRFVTMSEKQLNFYQIHTENTSIVKLKTVEDNRSDQILESFCFVSAKIMIIWYRNNNCCVFDYRQMAWIQKISKLESTITSMHSCRVYQDYFIAVSLADQRLLVLRYNPKELTSLVGSPKLGKETPRCCQICESFVVYGCDSGKVCLIKSDQIEDCSTDVIPEWCRQHSNGSYVNHLAISMDEKYIVSAADSIKLWKSFDGTLLQTFISHGDISRLFVHFASPSILAIVGNNGHHNGQDDHGQEGEEEEEEEADELKFMDEDDEEEDGDDHEDEDEETDQTDGQSTSTMNDINITIVAITKAKSLYILESYRR